MRHDEWAEEASYRLLALLYIAKWAKYRKSTHVWKHRDPQGEFKRLFKVAKAKQVPSNPPDPEETHLDEQAFAQMLQVFTMEQHEFHPTNQEAYLTVEVLGRVIGFKQWSYLASKAGCPWSFWEGTMPGNLDAAHKTAKTFVWALSMVLDRKPLPPKVWERANQ